MVLMSTPVGNVPTLEHVQACCDDGGREAISWSHCCWEKAGFVWLHSGSHLLKHYRMASEAMRLCCVARWNINDSVRPTVFHTVGYSAYWPFKMTPSCCPMCPKAREELSLSKSKHCIPYIMTSRAISSRHATPVQSQTVSKAKEM